MELPADSISLGVVKAGSEFRRLWDGRVVVVHPTERPLLVTLGGLVPIDTTVIDEGATATISIGFRQES
jgi:hypothetical protein